MRSVGGEFLSVALVLALPAMIFCSFPVASLGFRAEDGVRRSASASFVRLTPKAERRALQSVRTSWQKRGGEARRLQADLFAVELPEVERMSVLSVRDRCPPPAPLPLTCEWRAFPPSLQASPPLPIKAEPVVESPAFPREELLKLN